MALSSDALYHRAYLQILWGDIHVPPTSTGPSPIWSRALPLVRLREALFPWVSSELLHAKAISLPADSSRKKWTVVSHLPPPLLFPLIDFRTFVFPVSSFLFLCSFSFLFPDSFSVAHSLNNNVLGSCMFKPLFTLYASPGIFNPRLWVNYYLRATHCQVNPFCLLLCP